MAIIVSVSHSVALTVLDMIEERPVRCAGIESSTSPHRQVAFQGEAVRNLGERGC
jgi:hypothetical protein